MKDLFLSYASKDKRWATIFVEALEKEGWTVWWDQTLLAGQDYESKITEELRKSRGVVVLLSHASVNSQWVKAECNYAMDLYKKPLLPVLLENVQIPIRFYTLNAVNLTNWVEGVDYQEFTRLLESLRALIGAPLPQPYSGPKKKSPQEDKLASPGVTEAIIPDRDPSLTTKGLSRFIFLPFGIPFVILLLSHVLIKLFG